MQGHGWLVHSTQRRTYSGHGMLGYFLVDMYISTVHLHAYEHERGWGFSAGSLVHSVECPCNIVKRLWHAHGTKQVAGNWRRSLIGHQFRQVVFGHDHVYLCVIRTGTDLKIEIISQLSSKMEFGLGYLSMYYICTCIFICIEARQRKRNKERGTSPRYGIRHDRSLFRVILAVVGGPSVRIPFQADRKHLQSKMPSQTLLNQERQ